MSNFTLKPRSGADLARIVGWADRFNFPIKSPKDENGNVVFDFGSTDLKASTAYSDLKRIATFDNVSEE